MGKKIIFPAQIIFEFLAALLDIRSTLSMANKIT